MKWGRFWMSWDSTEYHTPPETKNNPIPLIAVGLVIGVAFGALGALTLRSASVEEPTQKLLDRSTVLIGSLLLVAVLLLVVVIQNAS